MNHFTAHASRQEGASMAEEKKVAQVGGDHYDKGDLPQHWDLSIMYMWDPFQYQITKYVMRWKDKYKGNKAKQLEDLKKARSFLDKYIQNYEKFLNSATLGDSATEFAKAHPAYLHNERFTCEGGLGNGINIYKCRKCRKDFKAESLMGASQQHPREACQEGLGNAASAAQVLPQAPV